MTPKVPETADLLILKEYIKPETKSLEESIAEVNYSIDMWNKDPQAERRALYSLRRRLREAEAKIRGSHTPEQWNVLLNIFNHRCACCLSETIGNPTKDHIVPISLGGDDSISNLQPLCRECNSSNNSLRDYRPDWLVEIFSEGFVNV